ncbi:MAG: polyhydroxyalkanoate synthesis repressor PhaR [Alphaproteobacteria bacterium]
MAESTDDTKPQAKPVVIKKYANRRLYNTAASSYVTLDNLAEMVRDGVEFTVFDAKTGEDITRPVLTQIIVDAEAKGNNLLPTSFLRQLIGFYGDSLQGLVPRYLDYSMRMFQNNQDRYRQYFNGALEGMFPMTAFEEISRQNMAIFERAMQMFNPLAGDGGGNDEAAKVDAARPRAEPAAKRRDAATDKGDIDELKKQLRAMQQQLDRLSKDRDDDA